MNTNFFKLTMNDFLIKYQEIFLMILHCFDRINQMIEIAHLKV